MDVRDGLNWTMPLTAAIIATERVEYPFFVMYAMAIAKKLSVNEPEIQLLVQTNTRLKQKQEFGKRVHRF